MIKFLKNTGKYLRGILTVTIPIVSYIIRYLSIHYQALKDFVVRKEREYRLRDESLEATARRVLIERRNKK